MAIIGYLWLFLGIFGIFGHFLVLYCIDIVPILHRHCINTYRTALEGRKDKRKGGRKGGKKEGKKEWEEERKEGKKEGRKAGKKDGRKERTMYAYACF